MGRYIRDPSMSVDELVKSYISKLGENIKVARFVRFNMGESQQQDEESEEVSEVERLPSMFDDFNPNDYDDVTAPAAPDEPRLAPGLGGGAGPSQAQRLQGQVQGGRQ